ncbi:type I restriction endonuclease [Adlercreutzia rubneri]
MGRPEDEYVKLPAIIHATRIGYRYHSIKGDVSGIDYDVDTNTFFEPFREALERINSRPVDADKAHYLVSQLKLKLSGNDLGRAFFACLQSSLEGYRLIDFENPANNDFTVVTELPYANGEDSFRPDITFLVNGMPLGFMEVKRENNKDGILAEHDRMHARFKNEAYRRFANIVQVMAFSNNQEYDDEERKPVQGSFYAASAYGRLMLNHFREEDLEEMAHLVVDRDSATEKLVLRDNNMASIYGTAEFESSINPAAPANRIITSVFSPTRFLFLLHYGIAYVEKVNDEGIKRTEKHVMRYPQLFATMAVGRVLAAGGGHTKGVIWHTQGSGKTALSFFLTRYLRDYYQAKNRVARFFFIVDRLDLADQAKGEFEARGAVVALANSREEFARSLKGIGDDTNVVSAERVPFITVVNIQKFDEGAVATDFDYDLDVQRVYFIDEAHRDYKRGGAFLTNLVTSDREAVRIALTGTPLVNTKDGRNDTKQVFGPYVHKYFYNQSIADGYTLKLLREPVKIEFRLKMQEVLRDLKEVKKLVDMEKVYAHKSYVDPLCDYIVDDYLKSQIALGDESIGAMVVAHSSAQARAIYARLAELDPDVSTELVINGETEARHRLDSELILHDEGTKETRRAICDNFKKDDSPINILVVYNMLLTGFDAHRLKKLYLCRTIKAHNLLQALTRVNRPYKDMAFGYVVDFADITEEYDKTNRAYLTELTEELGDATKDYSSLFEDPATIKADLAKIKDLLFSYTTDNMVEFKAEINAIDDKAVLYDLRAALARYKDLRNVVKQQGYEELYDKFDVGRVREMLGEVSLRIQAINNKEALALQDMSTGAVNLLLSKMEFRFRNIGSEELEVADEFQNKLKRTYESFAHNFDAKDPEYVNLLEELRSRFEKVNIEEMTSADMAESVKELDSLRGKMEDLNRRNAALAKKYGGDEKFARAHKQAMRTPPPLTTSPTTMFSILSSVKQGADEAVMSNRNMLGNAPYFAKQVRRLVAVACKDAGVKYSLVQVKSVAEYISKEYIDERGRAA